MSSVDQPNDVVDDHDGDGDDDDVDDEDGN